MRVIKKGKLIDLTQQITCEQCNSILEVKNSEIKSWSDMIEKSSGYYINCMVCTCRIVCNKVEK
jgi:Fe2+ or Zn2+ uptake regulation protein